MLQLRQTEIQQLRARLREHDVAGFQIAVRHALAVRLVQRVGNLDGVLQHLLDRQRTFLQSLRERLAFQILHHQIIDSVLMSCIVKRADMRMIQAGNRLRFALEAFAQVSAVGEMSGKNLDGDDSIEARIAGLVHLAHSTRTNSGEDFVGP